MSVIYSHSPEYVIRQLLIQLGAGTDAGTWPIKVAQEPDAPDNCITIYGTLGKREGRLQTSGEVEEKPGFQIRIRAQSHEAGYAKASEIVRLMDQSVLRTSVTIGSSQYLVDAITRTSDVLRLGKDRPTSARHLFTINAIVSLSQTS